MATPTTRNDLKEWCLRRLGKPVIDINVDDTQLEDRLDEALQYFAEFHYAGAIKMFTKHQVTQSEIDNGYITMGSDVLSVLRIFPVTAFNSSGFFATEFRKSMLSMYAFSSQGEFDLLSYDMAKKQLNKFQQILSPEPQINFSVHSNKLYIHWDWDDEIEAGEYLMIECYKKVDSGSHAEVFNDLWLKQYTTALFKEQWGLNLKKFGGVELPGGIVLNGKEIFDEAMDEKQQLFEQLRETFEEPPDFMTG